MNEDSVDLAVSMEEKRQLDLWGEQNHQDGTSASNRDIADAARESCEKAFKEGRGSWFDILLEEVMEASAEEDEDALMAELIQVAAVAKSWTRAILRRKAVRLLSIQGLTAQEVIHEFEGDVA